MGYMDKSGISLVKGYSEEYCSRIWELCGSYYLMSVLVYFYVIIVYFLCLEVI